MTLPIAMAALWALATIALLAWHRRLRRDAAEHGAMVSRRRIVRYIREQARVRRILARAPMLGRVARGEQSHAAVALDDLADHVSRGEADVLEVQGPKEKP